MKNWKRIVIFILIGTILLLPNEVMAESASTSEFSIKNVCIIILIAIILLLLYMGYRMDSNERETEMKRQKTNKKIDNAKPQDKYVNDYEYESDINEYEVDNVNPDEISETIEYEEDYLDDEYDDEKTLYEVANQSTNLKTNLEENIDSTRNFDTSELRKELSFSEEEIYEEYGEEFDISIIDDIDNLENDMDNKSGAIESINNFKESETEFSGFSVAPAISNEKSVKTTEKKQTGKKNTKSYVKTEEENIAEEIDTNETGVLEEDFVKQMKNNLELGSNNIKVLKEEKVVKKTSTRKKKTT